MSQKPDSAIRKLVDHHGGLSNVAELLGEGFPYQLIQQWVKRGWASPLHFQKLKPLMPKGMKLKHLWDDVEAVRGAQRKAKPAAEAA